MRTIGMYSHLDKKDTLSVELTMQQLVAKIVKMNYGEHRFLSELVIQRKASPEYEKYEEFRKHTAWLEALLTDGYY
jgi:hypothetical protein